jgi:hypothetical protein
VREAALAHEIENFDHGLHALLLYGGADHG